MGLFPAIEIDRHIVFRIGIHMTEAFKILIGSTEQAETTVDLHMVHRQPVKHQLKAVIATFGRIIKRVNKTAGAQITGNRLDQ